MDVGCDEGREEREEEVPEPVGSGRQSALLGTRPCWEGFTDQNPDTSANGVSCRVMESMLQTYGAQVVAKPQMNMQAETIITVWVGELKYYMSSKEE